MKNARTARQKGHCGSNSEAPSAMAALSCCRYLPSGHAKATLSARQERFRSFRVGLTAACLPASPGALARRAGTESPPRAGAHSTIAYGRSRKISATSETRTAHRSSSTASDGTGGHGFQAPRASDRPAPHWGKVKNRQHPAPSAAFWIELALVGGSGRPNGGF